MCSLTLPKLDEKKPPQFSLAEQLLHSSKKSFFQSLIEHTEYFLIDSGIKHSGVL